jgi:hypothetical protein
VSIRGDLWSVEDLVVTSLRSWIFPHFRTFTMAEFSKITARSEHNFNSSLLSPPLTFSGLCNNFSIAISLLTDLDSLCALHSPLSQPPILISSPINQFPLTLHLLSTFSSNKEEHNHHHSKGYSTSLSLSLSFSSSSSSNNRNCIMHVTKKNT